MNLLKPAVISALRDFSYNLYSSLDDAHGIEHGSRVVRLAGLIQSREGGDPSIVEAGGWLHQFHDNLEDLVQGLESLKLTQEARHALYHIVEVCRPNKIHRAKTVEAKIVYDADALEVLGAHGAIRELYCNTQFRGIGLREAVESTIEVQELFVSTMQTKTGRSLSKLAQSFVDSFWVSYRQWDELSPTLLSDQESIEQ